MMREKMGPGVASSRQQPELLSDPGHGRQGDREVQDRKVV